MEPLISIITVVRNDRDGLAATRAAVGAQALERIEWIVVDGASSDDTLSALDGMRTPIPRLISEPDRGLYDAMNKGLQVAAGRYVTFLNAGDVYLNSDVLSSVAAHAEMQAWPEMVFAGQVQKYPRGQMLEVPAHDCDVWIRYSLPASHQACFFDTDLHRRHPYDLAYTVTADYRAAAAMYAAGSRWASVPVIAVVSDKRRPGITFRHPLRQISEAARVQREVFGLSRRRVFLDAIRRLMPILFWRLSRYCPNLVRAAQAAGRGRVVSGGDGA